MKKIIQYICLFVGIFVLAGCLGIIGPSERVEDMLNRYIKNDQEILKELDKYLNKQDLTEEQRTRYKNIIKDEYSSIKYEIVNETEEEDKATVEVKITVKDLYSASVSAENELLNDPTKFYTEGVYDSKKYIDYKLELMEKTDKTVDYTIYINLNKKDNVWNVDDIDESTLEKIHGIYKYDKEENNN